jgi:2,3-bisphosphoglycerate-dependent phosphoglycerate mutase
MSRLILLRHGQSVWNLENRFTGWVDVDLTEDGEAQARRAGALMKAAGVEPDYAFTSVLKRAIRTLWLSLEAMDRVWTPVDKDWRLNERFYGALTGLNKAETAATHGEEQVRIWRRSYDTPPPELAGDHPHHPAQDERYAGLAADQLPGTESLKTTLARVKPYFDAAIAPRLMAGETILVAAHGNSLRALVKLIFGLDETAIMEIEVPTGNPMVIELDGLTPVSARYLDEDRAKPLPAIPKAAE